MYSHVNGEGKESKVQNISLITNTIVILHSAIPIHQSYFIYYTVVPCTYKWQ